MKIVNNTIGALNNEYHTHVIRPNSQKSFEEVVKNAINKVSGMQKETDLQIQSFLRGEPLDLHNIMISLEKSSISFKLLTEIRNKALTAYEEIMKMPL